MALENDPTTRPDDPATRRPDQPHHSTGLDRPAASESAFAPRDAQRIPEPEGVAPPWGPSPDQGESGIPGTRPIGGPVQVPGPGTSDISGNRPETVGMPVSSMEVPPDLPPGVYGIPADSRALPTARQGGTASPSHPAPPLGGNQYGKSVGGTAGGAAGAVGGALIGSVIGPAGTVVGGMIGAVAGALAGSFAGGMTAGTFNPSSEDEFWENNFVERNYYVAGMTYDDYGPAYRYGWEQCHAAHAGAIEEHRENLRQGWEAARGRSRLTWEQAEPAVRDAWSRMCERINATV